MPRGTRVRKSKYRKRPKPRDAKPIQPSNEGFIVTLFADIVGCSEISNHKNLREYNEFVNDFQNCFKKVCNHYKEGEYKPYEHPFFKSEVRGDEGCLMIFVSNGEDSLARDIDTAISIALDLKRTWLFTKDNRYRIMEDRLLPVDLGIGVHAGKVYINKQDKNKYRPEGYAINLAKRIESASRDGKFTHILLSEQARGMLYSLKDELTYRFDRPFAIKPRGISREIKVFEIKHHYLPTDWQDMPAQVSAISEELDDNRVDILRAAYEANPTNLWLAEEYLLLSMVNAHKKLGDEDQEDDVDALKKAYATAYSVAQHIANTELRDAGLLGILGTIAGELWKFKEEQDRYHEALVLDDQDGDIHWYLAYSMSYELRDKFDDADQSGLKIEQFYDTHKGDINRILEEYDRALELRPMNPWIAYDYACELSWWSQADQKMRKKAIDLLITAFSVNAKTKVAAKEEKDLKPVIKEQRVKQLLGKP